MVHIALLATLALPQASYVPLSVENPCPVSAASGLDASYWDCVKARLKAYDDMMRSSFTPLDGIVLQMQPNSKEIERDVHIDFCLLHYQQEHWFERMWQPHAYRKCYEIK